MRLPRDVRHYVVRPFLSGWIVEVALPNVLAGVADFLDVTADDAPQEVLRKALTSACKSGHTATVQWLVKKFTLTADDARAKDNLALQLACKGGHIATAAWLVDHFALTVDDARANNNIALRCAC
jgi:hypothetical protein